nr:hypothetical protein [Burkholderia gladioli]
MDHDPDGAAAVSAVSEGGTSAESSFSSLKKERIRKRIYKTRDMVRADVFDVGLDFSRSVAEIAYLEDGVLHAGGRAGLKRDELERFAENCVAPIMWCLKRRATLLPSSTFCAQTWRVLRSRIHYWGGSLQRHASRQIRSMRLYWRNDMRAIFYQKSGCRTRTRRHFAGSSIQ